MTTTHISAERVIDTPAPIVYHCIADYNEHHRPEGFLPPAFSDMQVEKGGVGAGTVISFTMTVGGRTRRVTQSIEEPQPGRVLVESGGSATTTFTVEPVGEQSHVRFDTVLEVRGIEGLLTRVFGPRLLRSLYLDELARLEQLARNHGPTTS